MGSTKKASPFSKKVSRQDVKRNRRAKSKAPGSGSHPSSQAQLKPKPKPKPSAAPHKNKSKRRIYTEEQLDIPKLNTITPAGVRKPRGKKKGKVFVDDQESMMTILAMVNADKEGQIESKLMRARQMEEIRQARQREIEARAEAKKSELEETKDSMRRRKRKTRPIATKEEDAMPEEASQSKPLAKKKKVSFS